MQGITALELTIAGAILAVLFVVAVAVYRERSGSARIEEAIADIRDIETAIERYQAINFELPDTLADAGKNLVDPWGNPYRYARIDDANGAGSMRKDRGHMPINGDYDLYSTGPDGQSQLALTAKRSRDDIIRANNGAFVGVAEAY